jgi:MazG family protein
VPEVVISPDFGYFYGNEYYPVWTEISRTRNMTKSARIGKSFEELVAILGTLRGPGGCPWDRAQDERTIRDYFLEEVYEAVEALEKGDSSNLAEELGDVLMEVVFLARIFEEKGAFTIADSLDRINAKMVARHPHVFGPKKAMTPEGVAEAWHKGKMAEKAKASILDEPGKATPALLSAFLLGRRASAHGFDWPDASGAMAKVLEEVEELDDAVRRGNRKHVAEEIGDLFLALSSVSRKLGINPELALRGANRKFVRRFLAMEKALEDSGKKLEKSGPEEMDAAWEKIKRRRRRPVRG